MRIQNLVAAAALEPRLPRLVIRVAAPVPGLGVLRDGAPVDGALLGTAMYVDPGEHTVTATAPGHAPFEATVRAVEAQEATVEIPALAPAPAASAGEGAGGPGAPAGPGGQDAPGGAGPALETASGGGSPVGLRAHAARPAGRTRRILGVSTGGAGVVALAAGLGVGWTAMSRWNDAFDQGLCDRDTRLCTPEGQAQADTARSRANLSNVLVGAGVVLAATGVVLYLSAPNAEPAERRARVVPVAGPDGLGFAVVGGF
jgi:hypothetical protein